MPKKPVYDDRTIVVRDKLYIPVEAIDAEEVEKKYTHYMYQESACRRCPNRPERHNFECDQCEAFKGIVATCNRTYKNGIEYLGLPLGDKLKFERKAGFDLDEFSIIDKRVKRRFDYPVRMRKDFQLRPYQQKANDEWWEHKHGLIVAPPRSGKTPTLLQLLVRIGFRAILLANQHEFLQQFLDHVEQMTNLPALERKTGKKLYGFPDKIEDFDTLQIAVCTYQQFMGTDRGKIRYARAIKNFGSVAVDEVHKSAANEFSRVINRWPSRIRVGVTGTDTRKDGRHIIMQETIGPTVSRVEIDQLTPKVIVHVCDFVKTRSKFRGRAGFVYACQFLARHKKRTEMILDYVGRDLKNGHSIVIPVYYKEHVFLLVKLINDMYGSEIAESFVGGGTKKNKELRARTLQRANSGKIRVVVGVRSIIQLGLNVPRWSCLYNIMPMNNEPNWKQESSRVLTPMENKRQPIIRMFVDPNIGLSLGCFVGTYKSSLKFKHAPTEAARERAAEMFELQGSSVKDAEEEYDLDYSEDDNYGGKRKKEKKRESKLKNKKAPKGLFSRR